MAMAARASSVGGMRTSHSPRTRARSARPPKWPSPTPHPFSTTWSPGFQAGSLLASTAPARSMPGTMGNVRTTGERPVMASASL
jgi:hypothetical protein